MRRLLVYVLVPLLLLVGACSSRSDGAKSPSTPKSLSAVKEIPAGQLPPEAREVLRLIDKGGPFPYRKDGTVFGNREGLLPKEQRGYYREYTVPTPGSKDRGARRIIAGKNGERYYTGDHYRSFVRVA